LAYKSEVRNPKYETSSKHEIRKVHKLLIWRPFGISDFELVSDFVLRISVFWQSCHGLWFFDAGIVILKRQLGYQLSISYNRDTPPALSTWPIGLPDSQGENTYDHFTPASGRVNRLVRFDGAECGPGPRLLCCRRWLEMDGIGDGGL
jgi:hypothetical protein